LTVAFLQRSHSGCEGFDRHKKCVSEEFTWILNTPLFSSSFPTDKNLKDLYQEAVGMYGENCLQTYTDVKFSPCFGVGDSLLIFVQHVRYIMYLYSIISNITIKLVDI
jgi:hypothetical protein